MKNLKYCVFKPPIGGLGVEVKKKEFIEKQIVESNYHIHN